MQQNRNWLEHASVSITQASAEITTEILGARFHISVTTPRASAALLSAYGAIKWDRSHPGRFQRFPCLACNAVVWVRHSEERLDFPPELSRTLPHNFFTTEEQIKKIYTFGFVFFFFSMGKSNIIQPVYLQTKKIWISRLQPNEYLAPTHSSCKGKGRGAGILTSTPLWLDAALHCRALASCTPSDGD